VFEGEEIRRLLVNHGVECFIRIVRSRKADMLRKAYAKHGDKVDIIVVEDLTRGDFTDALKGVSAVIHAAAPIPGREALKDVIEAGYLPSCSPI
jgi:saccharopine dehydrogenase-like NADP-dependent oxidoreductase